MKPDILLAEDDNDLGHVLKLYLEMHDMSVTWVTDGQAAMDVFNSRHFDICILDVSMPKQSGFKVAEYIITRTSDMPFLFLTAKKQKHDRIQGLKMGAIDYITKPFEADELVLRIQNILSKLSTTLTDFTDKIQIGSYTLDPTNLLLIYKEDRQQLTEKECQILVYLANNQNKLMPKKNMLEHIWQQSDYFTSRSMDVFISRLRKYLSRDVNVKILRVRGQGIKLEVDSN